MSLEINYQLMNKLRKINRMEGSVFCNIKENYYFNKNIDGLDCQHYLLANNDISFDLDRYLQKVLTEYAEDYDE